MARSRQVRCPVCEERFEIEIDLEVGDVAACPGCYVDLKILSLHPVEVEETQASDEDADDGAGGADDGADDDGFAGYH